MQIRNNVFIYYSLLSTHDNRFDSGSSGSWEIRQLHVGNGGEIFRTCPDRPWGLPSLLYKGYRVFPGGKAAEAWC